MLVFFVIGRVLTRLEVYTERHAALHITATLLQARAVDAAPLCGAPKRDEEV